MNQSINHPEHDPAVFDRFARFYDADYRDYMEDVPLILDLAEAAGGPVLELGCGTGRLLLPLARAAQEGRPPVTGIDISPALLAIARQKLAGVLSADEEGLVTLVQDDLRTFSLAGLAETFAFAFCASNTLMHLATPAEQLAVLNNAARHLRPGGLLLIDLFNPDIARLIEVNGLMELADRWQDADGGQVLKWSVRLLDLAAQVQETTFIYEEISPVGQVQRTVCPFTLRFLWRNEAELMLAQAGFSVRAVWGDFDGNDYDSASERLILLGEKNRA